MKVAELLNRRKKAIQNPLYYYIFYDQEGNSRYVPLEKVPSTWEGLAEYRGTLVSISHTDWHVVRYDLCLAGDPYPIRSEPWALNVQAGMSYPIYYSCAEEPVDVNAAYAI